MLEGGTRRKELRNDVDAARETVLDPSLRLCYSQSDTEFYEPWIRGNHSIRCRANMARIRQREELRNDVDAARKKVLDPATNGLFSDHDRHSVILERFR